MICCRKTSLLLTDDRGFSFKRNCDTSLSGKAKRGQIRYINLATVKTIQRPTFRALVARRQIHHFTLEVPRTANGDFGRGKIVTCDFSYYYKHKTTFVGLFQVLQPDHQFFPCSVQVLHCKYHINILHFVGSCLL